jgi:hypothetical protein
MPGGSVFVGGGDSTSWENVNRMWGIECIGGTMGDPHTRGWGTGGVARVALVKAPV